MKSKLCTLYKIREHYHITTDKKVRKIIVPIPSKKIDYV